MTVTIEQLTRVRDNLDGLGYSFGPRGLFGIGNEQNVFDLKALGGGSITPNNTLRSLPVFDAYSRAAIYQFQRDQGIVATGNYGDDLRDRLEKAVRILQNNLKIVFSRNDKDLVTGYYGLKTFQLVKEYQAQRGLPVTGIATAAVQKMLNDEARRLVGSPSPSPTPNPGSSDLQSRMDKLAELKRLFQGGNISRDGFLDEAQRLIP
jgi:peptidoglycan hydrolase-like protein with peptidoglycan-binding domain